MRSTSTLKSARSRLLIPITSASSSSASSSSSSRWISTSTSRSSSRARSMQPAELARGRRAHHHQHRVAPGRLGLEQLVGIDREVLAQDREPGRRARLAQVVEGAAEVLLLGEDRQRRGAAALVGLHQRRCRWRPRESSPPTASGACARRSPRCPAATAPRRTAGRPRRRPPTARARQTVPRSCGARTERRVADTSSSSRMLTPSSSCAPRIVPGRPSPRRCRSTPRPGGRPLPGQAPAPAA